MNKINYQKELEKKIDEFQKNNSTPDLLIHSCCAPCSSYVLEYLSEYFHITDFYYNPNIQSEAEYRRRVDEIQRLIKEMPLKNPVEFVEGEYDPKVYTEAIRGLEKEPEGGKRCEVCFRLRLEEAAIEAAKRNIEYFTTTLTISPMKDPALLNSIGEEVAAKHGVKFLPSEFRKKGGYLRSIQLSKEYDLYRQDYCGCVYSKLEMDRRRAEKAKENNI